MDVEHKLFAIHLLKRVAMADKAFHMSEQAYVDQAAVHLGLDQTTANQVKYTQFEVSKMPSREQDRMTILYYLLFLSNVDGNILREEKNEIRKIGFELGFRDEQIQKMLEIVEKNQANRLDPEELIGVIRIVLN